MISNKVSGIRLFGGLLILSLSVKSYAFGALFTSPQQRETLNQQRSQEAVFSPKPKATLRSTTTSAPKQKKIFFNGYVIRNSGPDTAWANDKKISDNDSQISAKLNRIKGTSVPIKSSAISKTRQLQPGQSLNLETGKITESYSQKQPTPPISNTKITVLSDQPQTKNPQNIESELQTEESENDISEQE